MESLLCPWRACLGARQRVKLPESGATPDAEIAMPFASRWFLAVCLCVLMTGKGHAQLGGFYPFGADSLSLDNADFGMMIDAANGLLRKTPLRPGDSVGWRNQQTGSNGTILVTDSFRHDRMPCHTLTYETIPAATPPATKTVLKWCKTPASEWKILSLG